MPKNRKLSHWEQVLKDMDDETRFEFLKRLQRVLVRRGHCANCQTFGGANLEIQDLYSWLQKQGLALEEYC